MKVSSGSQSRAALPSSPLSSSPLPQPCPKAKPKVLPQPPENIEVAEADGPFNLNAILASRPCLSRRNDLDHDLLHSPARDDCITCRIAAARSSPHKQGGSGKAESEAKTFGDLIVADHKIVPVDASSISGDRTVMVITDLATRFMLAVPDPTKSTESVKNAFIQFAGRDLQNCRCGVDDASELRAAVHSLNGLVKQTVPYDSQSSGTAERRIGLVSSGCRRLLHRAGVPLSLWNYVMTYWSFMYNISATNAEGVSPWTLRHKTPVPPCPWLHYPAFGSAARAVPPIEVRKHDIRSSLQLLRVSTFAQYSKTECRIRRNTC
jgi:hypothetical protein